ncbi:MAG: S9 family peptidase [Chloroflexota bacterium]
MTERKVLPYGSWPSPISVDMAVSGNLGLREPRFDGDDVYWTEGRPQEQGRQVIVRWNERDGAVDVTPPNFNARTMAHEYGGGWYAVADGTVYFTAIADGRIYRQPRGAEPVALTAEGPYRYGDLTFDRAHNRLLAVREDMTRVLAAGDGAHHAPEGGRIAEPEDTLVAIDLASGAQTVLAQGYDFYNTPRPSPDGKHLVWLSWRHPNMPWDSTEIWLADLDAAGMPVNPRLIAGGPDESAIQPEWAPDGSLVFVSDRSGWWNLYRWTDTGSGSVVPIAPTDAEFAGPLWVFGLSWYGIEPHGTIVAMVRRAGADELWRFPVGGAPSRIDVPDTSIGLVQVSGNRVLYIGLSPAQPSSVVLVDLATGTRRVLKQAYELTVDAGYISAPEAITFPTTDGDVAHAWYYPPTNPEYAGPEGTRPPLVLMNHGGPTSLSPAMLDLGKEFFTSRGFAVVDVNYRGSNGYGREYMRKLYGKWGIYDVDDCIAAAQFLAARGDVDPARMAIRGGSAGGYTTLCALAFHDVFAAGASYFGVGDVEALARETHKFESRYMDQMIGPYPQAMDLYRERSPIHHVEGFTKPLLVLQGRDDMVVPIAQADQIVEALQRRHIPYAYLPFDGEGHGFRQAANIRRSLEAEASFYAQVFGFTLADGFEPVKVEFLAIAESGTRSAGA